MTTRERIHLSRRQLLLGTAGVTLALPVLPSLLTRTAYGADPVFVRRPRLYWLTTNHGAALESNLFPSESGLTTSESLFADHSVRAGPLQAVDEGPYRAISPVLRADRARFSSRLLGAMNVLRGLDIPFSIGHHSGGHLGNYAQNDGLAGPAVEVKGHPRPTIDQLIAWSPTFYDDLSAVRERCLVMGKEAVSWNYSNPGAATGTIQNVRGAQSSLELFDKTFLPADATAEAMGVPVVDHVLESYRRLRNANQRLSAADRRRLDDHMDRIAELQRKLGAERAASCAGVVRPDRDSTQHPGLDPADASRHAQLFNEVAAAAFHCGASRVAVLSLDDELRFGGYTGDWHNDVAHEWLNPDRQSLLVNAYQRVFESVFLDMAARLDAEEAPGMTFLDNSLLVWSQESGMSTHDPVSIPIVTAGSAAGALRTGQSLDYRRVGDPKGRFDPQADGYFLYAGVTYNQFLANVLRAMGLSPSEFERWGHRGYGVPLVDPVGYGILPFAEYYENTNSRYFQIASDPLPFLTT